MNEDKFSLLISILDSLEKEDINHSNLENAIVRLMDHFDEALTKDQKEELSKEFIHYERVRQDKENHKKSLTEDEINRELLERFLAGETYGSF
jgi:hypothetical protein